MNLSKNKPIFKNMLFVEKKFKHDIFQKKVQIEFRQMAEDEKFNKSVEDELICAICYGIAEEALESQCCHKLFCETCIEELKSSESYKPLQCPLCRASASFQVKQEKSCVSKFARRLIDALPTTCPNNCEAKNLVRGNIKQHLTQCPNSKYTCSYPKCDFSGNLQGYQQHIQERHGSDLVTAFDAFWKKTEQSDNSASSNTSWFYYLHFFFFFFFFNKVE
ncbi:hypothetical protein RFI_17038 [Reticulomyxa filosa]|uniref:RING-type E3 ubiquitin transferase n=1 Tax=Reticulomyxa filosa TaxID=46433 RepID=X6N4D6_RETFI|nr:hypothetical protein RFI_17038 [Reticulomyxa filosa]|eukprot:ETO20182.1 hypothetical protein RFI_17038 [Reticulomyxa filosa]